MLDLSWVTLALVRAKEFFPTLNTDGAVARMRQRPSLPGSLPIVDRAPKGDNVFLNLGHGHKGFTTAAITGKLTAELMDSQPASVNLHACIPSNALLCRRAAPAESHKGHTTMNGKDGTPWLPGALM